MFLQVILQVFCAAALAWAILYVIERMLERWGVVLCEPPLLPPMQCVSSPGHITPPQTSSVCSWDSKIFPYLDKELSRLQREAFEEHCRGCSFCDEEVERIREVRAKQSAMSGECTWVMQVAQMHGSSDKSVGDWVQDVCEHVKYCAPCQAYEEWLFELRRKNHEVVALEQAFAAPTIKGRTP